MYLDKGADKVQGQPVAKDRLDKDAEGKDVCPDHNALAPAGPTQAQRLTPHLLLFLGHAVQFPLFLFLTSFDVLVLPWSPLQFAALVQELGAVLLKGGDREQCELGILGHLDR